MDSPAAKATRKLAPALAAGCTAMPEPADETPLTALAVARQLHEAGVPEGVVEVVTTTWSAEVVTAWLRDQRVRKVSFTSSTEAGRALLRQAADRVLNASMELGPAVDGAAIGPLISAATVERVRAAVAGAVAEGARVSHRAALPDAPGWFGAPTVLVSDPSAPFGGVEQSGLGREGAREGLGEFQEPQLLSVRWA